MKTESNRRVNLRTQSMARNDFPMLNHLFPLPLVSRSDKQHKESMFLHLLRCIPFIRTSLFNTYFVHNLLYVCPIWLII